MKTVLLSALSSLYILGFTGCNSFWNQPVCPPVKNAQFNMDAFGIEPDTQIKYWVTKTPDETYVIQTEKDFYSIVEQHQTLKADYNLLINSINKFNNELNSTKEVITK